MDTPPFAYPNFNFNQEEFAQIATIPQPFANNTLIINRDQEFRMDFASRLSAPPNALIIDVGPKLDPINQPDDRFERAAQAMGIPEEERAARATQIETFIYFLPLSIILLHHVHRCAHAWSPEHVDVIIHPSVLDSIDVDYFRLLVVNSPFMLHTLRTLRIVVGDELRDGFTQMLVQTLPNGPRTVDVPECITTFLKVAVDECYDLFPRCMNSRISRLLLDEPRVPYAFQLEYSKHLNAFLNMLQHHAGWITELEINLAFADSLPGILAACGNLENLTSLIITECDSASCGKEFDPDDEFRDDFCRGLQPLMGLRQLTLPAKLQSGLIAYWYPYLRVEIVPDLATQSKAFREMYMNSA